MFLALLAYVVSAGMKACGGHLVYPMDDTYIHMAMAKNFGLHGVWGVTRYAFSSSTSSPLYTLLLAMVYGISGVHEWTPLILNAVAGLGVLWVADKTLRTAGLRPVARFLGEALLVVAVPLPILAFGGMEHVVHLALTLLFVLTYLPVLLGHGLLERGLAEIGRAHV